MDNDSSDNTVADNYQQSSSVAKTSTMSILAILALLVFLGIIAWVGYYVYKTGSINKGVQKSVRTAGAELQYFIDHEIPKFN